MLLAVGGAEHWRHSSSSHYNLRHSLLLQDTTVLHNILSRPTPPSVRSEKRSKRKKKDDKESDHDEMPSLFRFGKKKRRNSSKIKKTNDAAADDADAAEATPTDRRRYTIQTVRKSEGSTTAATTTTTHTADPPNRRQEDTILRSSRPPPLRSSTTRTLRRSTSVTRNDRPALPVRRSSSTSSVRRWSFSKRKSDASTVATADTQYDANPDGTLSVPVPHGVTAGGSFVVRLSGRPFLVECPGHPFRLPDRKLSVRPFDVTNDGEECRRVPETTNGWTSVASFSDSSTRWVRTDRAGVVLPPPTTLDARIHVVVPRWDDPDDPDMLQGTVEIVGGADHAERTTRETILVRGRTLEERREWFFDRCDRARREGADEKGQRSLNISVRRESLVTDSLNAVMSLTRKDLLLEWSVTFDGEDSYDPKMATREWFETVADEMLHPENGLFQFSPVTEGEQKTTHVQINPCSDMAFPDTHLICFRVLGRILGKALLDGRPLPNHMAPHLIKMLVGWPLDLSDLRHTDDSCYTFLNGVESAWPDELEGLGLFFTAVRDVAGRPEPVELVPNGCVVPVNADNVREYLETSLEYYLLGETRTQVAELAAGFFDSVPAEWSSVFSPDEMATLMSTGRERRR